MHIKTSENINLGPTLQEQQACKLITRFLEEVCDNRYGAPFHSHMETFEEKLGLSFSILASLVANPREVTIGRLQDIAARAGRKIDSLSVGYLPDPEPLPVAVTDEDGEAVPHGN